MQKVGGNDCRASDSKNGSLKIGAKGDGRMVKLGSKK